MIDDPSVPSSTTPHELAAALPLGDPARVAAAASAIDARPIAYALGG
ncbi:MAG: hypothetical protein WCH13_14725 [Deltaproteobacteria bacterium]